MISKPVAILITVLLVVSIIIGYSYIQIMAPEDNDLIFIHHSTGYNWLSNKCGSNCLEPALLAKDYVDERNDVYYGTDVIQDAGRPDSLAPTPGDKTDMNHWLFWFNDYFEGMKYHGCANGFNHIIMFKSCFPISKVWSEGTEPGNPFNAIWNPDDYTGQTVANYKAVYRHPNGPGNTYTQGDYEYKPLEDIFVENSDILFISVTAPPMCKTTTCTNSNEANNARIFNNWLTTTWINDYNTDNPGLNNVAVYDYFDFLANPPEYPTYFNRLKDVYYDGGSDSHPNVLANEESTTDFATKSGNFIDTIWNLFDPYGGNNPPTFSNEVPSDGATNVPLTTSLLSVEIDDPEGDYITEWSITTSPNIGSSSGGGTGAPEDFLGYTKIDPPPDSMDISLNSVTHNSYSNEHAYLYYAKDPNHFGDFEHDVTMTMLYSVNNRLKAYWQLANVVKGWRQIWDDGDVSILVFGRGSGPPQIYLYEIHDGTTDSDTYDAQYNVPYYLTIKKQGLDLTCDIYLEETRTPPAEATLSITLDSDYQFQYIYATNSFFQGVNERQEGITADLDLKEGDPGGTKTCAISNLQYETTYTWTVQATDSEGGQSTGTYTFTTEPFPNEPPVASFTTSTDDRTVYVDASESSDPDGDTLTYDWDWGDSTTHGSGMLASHSYVNYGTYTIKLIVDDGNGGTDETTRTVVLTLPPPDVTCWKCEDGSPVSEEFPYGTVCGVEPALEYPFPTEPDDCPEPPVQETPGFEIIIFILSFLGIISIRKFKRCKK